MKITKTVERWSPLIVLAAVLLLWQLLVMLLEVPEFIFPSPWQIGLQFIEFQGPLLEAAWKTFWVTMLGFGLSIAVGVLLGLALANHPKLLVVASLVALFVSANRAGCSYPEWPVVLVARLGAWAGLRAGRTLGLFSSG